MLSRRTLLAGLALLPWWAQGRARLPRARILVVGGGFAGACAARLLKQAGAGLEVTLIEPKALYHTCPMSNRVISGQLGLSAIAWDYRELQALGVQQVRQLARDVDSQRRRLQLDDGRWLPYDRLLLAPGIEMRYDAIEGYDRAAAQRMPHAWQAGEQTALLQRRLAALEDGQLMLMGVPDNPYRCPPGPYERVSLIADYLKRHKPRSKLLVLDSKDSFSKQALFFDDWQRRHAGRVEWLGRSSDGRVVRADADRGELECEFGSRHRAALVNLIPPQQAGLIARRAGLCDASGWVPVSGNGFYARLQPDIQVFGDACIAAPMPKSAFSAQAQARMAVAWLLAELRDQAPPLNNLSNTCYSLLDEHQAVSIGARYHSDADGLLSEVPGSQWLSPLQPAAGQREREAQEVLAWYQGICRSIWGARA